MKTLFGWLNLGNENFGLRSNSYLSYLCRYNFIYMPLLKTFEVSLCELISYIWKFILYLFEKLGIFKIQINILSYVFVCIFFRSWSFASSFFSLNVSRRSYSQKLTSIYFYSLISMPVYDGLRSSLLHRDFAGQLYGRLDELKS